MKINFPKKKYIFYGVITAGIALSLTILHLNTMATVKVIRHLEETENVTNESESVSVFSIPDMSSDVLFRLYECGGKIGIYDANSNILIDIIDVLTSTLPKADKQALKKGIDICTLKELAKIIDDFSS